MFEITTKDQDLFDEVERLYPMSEEEREIFEKVEYITVDKQGGWYYVVLHTDEDKYPYLKSTRLPVLHIKRVKYYSGKMVYVSVSMLTTGKVPQRRGEH